MMMKPTLADKKVLKEITVMVDQSGMNASFSREEFPVQVNQTRVFSTSAGDVEVKSRYNSGYTITMPDKRKVFVSFCRQGKGSGIDLGAHFCSQDQVLIDLLI